MKSNRTTKTILTLICFLALSSVFAQGPADPDPTADDPGADLNPAPIGDYVLPMLILGVVTAFVLLKKKVSAQV
jgi:hypothetical protein